MNYNFYPGQKVVFVDDNTPSHPNANPPKDGEVVTVSGNCRVIPGNYSLKEYPLAKCGLPQSVHGKYLRPLLDDSIEYANKLIKELETEINEDNLILK